jgi:orotidine-5'-phosphate decarboxylase
VIPRPVNPLVVALDVSALEEAETLATLLGPRVGMLKVGLELSWAIGPEAVRRVAAHGPVFVDCKLHDIPNTVERAAANIARQGVAMLNVHALGGEAMMRAALAGARRGADDAGVEPPLVVAVTVLSSQAGEGLASPASLAFEARAAGLDGVVVSGDDVDDVRATCGEEFCLVVPGIRPAGANGHDQVRILTPREAVEKGADYLVIGRPVTASPDPAGVADTILREVR